MINYDRASCFSAQQAVIDQLLFIGLRSHPQVRLHFSNAFRELLNRVFSRNRRHHHTVSAIRPVCRSRNTVIVRHLQRVDYAQQLIKVPSSAGGIRNAEAKLFFVVDHEHRSYSQSIPRTGIRVNHVIESRNLLIFIRQNREINGATLGFVDVADPASVRSRAIYT